MMSDTLCATESDAHTELLPTVRGSISVAMARAGHVQALTQAQALRSKSGSKSVQR